MGLTGSAAAQGQSCAAQLGSTPKVSEIIDCLKTQETELQRLRGSLARIRAEIPEAGLPKADVEQLIQTQTTGLASKKQVDELRAEIPKAGLLKADVEQLIQTQTTGLASKKQVMPKGAVVAFDLANGCPDDTWSPISDFEGRVIVGAHKDRAAEFGYRAIGGEERVTLSERNIPPHQHVLPIHDGGGPPGFGWTQAQNSDGRNVLSVQLGSLGEGRHNPLTLSAPQQRSQEPTAFTNMPPYIALYFCKKN